MNARSAQNFSSRAYLALAIIISAVFCFLGVMYILASAIAPTRLFVGVILIGLGLFILIFTSRKLVKPPPIVVYWSPSGPVKPEELKCPNCGAPLEMKDPSMTRIVCRYCGRVVEIVEEPKW